MKRFNDIAFANHLEAWVEELDDASPSLACDHRLHAVCLQELAATAWAEGAARTRARGTAVLCPCCRGQSYVK